MAKAEGVPGTTVGHVWRPFGLLPHRSETFKLPSLFTEVTQNPA